MSNFPDGGGPLSLIPRPASVTAGGPAATLADRCVIECDAALAGTGELLRTWLRAATGWQVTVAPPPAGPGTAIRLRLDESGRGGEGYRVAVGADGVTITGSTPAGVFYGVQTLRQLLPADFLRTAPPPGPVPPVSVPGVVVSDEPRLGWRGAHLDVARHFMPKAWILRMIDLLALHKINVLHLHLTDDQGWRMPVERYPLLTEVGAWRRESPVGPSRERRFDGRPHGGFYTKSDLTEIVAYAARQFITVVPEIDMPGHMQAAIAAYPRLGNTGERVGVRCAWGISEHVLNLEPGTLQFCRDVLDEAMEIFPAQHVHIGGDECPTREWEASEPAQQLMASLGITDERFLQGWFTTQMTDHLRDSGRTAVLWDEALESGAPADALIMSWRTDVAGWYAAAAGHPVVMAPQYWTYFDWAQDADPAEPVAIHTATSLRRVHAFDPAPDGLPAAARAGIIGAQCQLWTEYVPGPEHAEYMYFPRLCAFAESAWSRPGGDYGEFTGRLTGHLERLDALGVNYRPLAGPTRGQMRSWPGQEGEHAG